LPASRSGNAAPQQNEIQKHPQTDYRAPPYAVLA
jgi:hypothetical protein